MSATSRCFCLLLTLGLFASPVPATAQILGSGLPNKTLLDRYDLELAWANQATINVDSDVVNYLTADEDVVVIQTRAGMMTVFDGRSGAKLWDAQLSAPNQYSYPVSTNSDKLFLVLGSTLYARDKFNGNQLWTLRLPNTPSTSPTVDDQRVYVGLMTGDVYAFDLEELASLQERGLLPTWRRNAETWRVSTSGRVIGPPISNGRFVAFTNSQGVLYSFGADRRTLNFAFESRIPASAPLEWGTGKEDGVNMTYIYYASGGNNFYCIRTTNGTAKWTYVTGAAILEQPSVIGDDIFLSPLESGTYNLNPATGDVRWWSPESHGFVAATPTRVYGTDAAGNLAILARADGGLVGTIPMKDFSIRVRNDRTDRIFVCTTRGRVACIKEKLIEQPLYHRHPDRRPILPIFPGEQVIGADPSETDSAPATDAVDPNSENLEAPEEGDPEAMDPESEVPESQDPESEPAV